MGMSKFAQVRGDSGFGLAVGCRGEEGQLHSDEE